VETNRFNGAFGAWLGTREFPPGVRSSNEVCALLQSTGPSPRSGELASRWLLNVRIQVWRFLNACLSGVIQTFQMSLDGTFLAHIP
jgi:hypothetical protein